MQITWNVGSPLGNVTTSNSLSMSRALLWLGTRLGHLPSELRCFSLYSGSTGMYVTHGRACPARVVLVMHVGNVGSTPPKCGCPLQAALEP
jgi:hypothetical protein